MIEVHEEQLKALLDESAEIRRTVDELTDRAVQLGKELLACHATVDVLTLKLNELSLQRDLALEKLERFVRQD